MTSHRLVVVSAEALLHVYVHSSITRRSTELLGLWKYSTLKNPCCTKDYTTKEERAYLFENIDSCSLPGSLR